MKQWRIAQMNGRPRYEAYDEKAKEESAKLVGFSGSALPIPTIPFCAIYIFFGSGSYNLSLLTIASIVFVWTE